jgi:hypothetical protein
MYIVNLTSSAGFTIEERQGFSEILKANKDGQSDMIDTWRHLHPNARRYTYFSYRFGCRPKYIGWRLDYFVTSASLLPRVLASEIRDEVYGASDHVPIMLLLDIKDWRMDISTTDTATKTATQAEAKTETTETGTEEAETSTEPQKNTSISSSIFRPRITSLLSWLKRG